MYNRKKRETEKEKGERKGEVREVGREAGREREKKLTFIENHYIIGAFIQLTSFYPYKYSLRC